MSIADAPQSPLFPWVVGGAVGFYLLLAGVMLKAAWKQRRQDWRRTAEAQDVLEEAHRQ